MSAATRGQPKTAAHRANISKGTTGKPKPWIRGEANPNFGNRAQGQPEARVRFLDGTRARGQAWSQEDRRRHAETMRGPSNAMRGRRHTPDALARMSAAKRQQYADGTVRVRRYKLSAQERAIAAHVRAAGHDVKQQFHIVGVPYLYDFYFPTLNLIVEYQGDYWHANPAKYAAGSLLSIQSVGLVRVEDIWARDADKRLAAESRGFRIAYVWESSFRALGPSAIDAVLESP